MSELFVNRCRYPDINLGGKDLLDITRYFMEIGWVENSESLKNFDLGVMMIEGNKQGARFWHGQHIDTLALTNVRLTRNCPTDGEIEVYSAKKP